MVETHTIDQIRDRADIVEVINHYVPLKKRGINFIGLCPFHNEKTPSMTVNKDKNIWHCFGCGAGGNIFNFLMKIENITFIESLKIVADEVGIEIEDDNYSNSEKNKYDRNYELLKDASLYYQNKISENLIANYIKERNLNEESINVYKVGYSGTSGKELLEKLKKKYSDAEIISSGLFYETRNGLKARFENRLIIPICDHRDRILGFGGRIIVEGNPKYLNSPETSIYHKSNVLFGLNIAKKHIPNNEASLILVEGYMDVISLYQQGIKNVVASSGTAFTSLQVQLISRFCKRVYLCFDNDNAGQKAILKAYESLKKSDLELRVIDLLDKKDPDEFLQTYSADNFAKQIREAVPIIKFLVDYAIAGVGGEKSAFAEDKSRIIKEVRPYLLDQDELIKDEYTKYIAKKIEVDFEVVRPKFDQYRTYMMRGGNKRLKSNQTNKDLKLEQEVLSVLINNVDVRRIYWSKFKGDDFEDLQNRKLFVFLKEHLDDKIDQLLELCDDDFKRIILALAMKDEILNKEEYLEEAIIRIKSRIICRKEILLKKDIRQVETEIKELTKTGNSVKLPVLNEKLSMLQKKKMELIGERNN